MESTVCENMPMRNLKRNHKASSSVFNVGGFNAKFIFLWKNKLIFFRISMFESTTEHITSQDGLFLTNYSTYLISEQL